MVRGGEPADASVGLGVESAAGQDHSHAGMRRSFVHQIGHRVEGLRDASRGHADGVELVHDKDAGSPVRHGAQSADRGHRQADALPQFMGRAEGFQAVETEGENRSGRLIEGGEGLVQHGALPAARGSAQQYEPPGALPDLRHEADGLLPGDCGPEQRTLDTRRPPARHRSHGVGHRDSVGPHDAPQSVRRQEGGEGRGIECRSQVV